MRLSLLSVAIFCTVACSNAIPIRDSHINSMVKRTYETDFVRDWPILESRTGPFAVADERTKTQAIRYLNGLSEAKVDNAATPSHRTKTYDSGDVFHFDRQQPTNAHGDHKVAIQLNNGRPSTIGQVVINKDHDFTRKTYLARMKHSIHTGQELRVPNSKKAQNIAANHAKHLAKQKLHAENHAAGMARAANGHYKKGKK